MKLHFIGIGGIGLSGLARYAKYLGYEVSGSDMKSTPLTKRLQEEGIKVFIPHSKDSITNQDLVVYSAVIKSSNPEIVQANKLGIPIKSRREYISNFLSNKKVISVCGAHGKSTTTAILASILPNFSAIIGAESKEFDSNVRYKKGEYLIFEADESDGSFIDSNPYVSVVTNTEPEHMEYYNHDYKLFYSHYKQFLKKAKIRVVNGDDSFIQTLNLDMKKVFIKDVTNIRYEVINSNPKTIFEYKGYEFEVYGFGEHLILDALLAIETANEFISMEQISKNIKNFKGIKKRFDILQNREGLILIDDYGHHPTEIKATLKSARKFAKLNNIDEVIAIWQPHKYSRTVENLDAFVKCFEGVDKLVILPVWSAGEEKIDIDFKDSFKRYNPIFADKISVNSENIMLISKKSKKKIKKGLIIGFGAGDITYQLRNKINTN